VILPNAGCCRHDLSLEDPENEFAGIDEAVELMSVNGGEQRPGCATAVLC
jgi:hypothetical protein